MGRKVRGTGETRLLQTEERILRLKGLPQETVVLGELWRVVESNDVEVVLKPTEAAAEVVALRAELEAVRKRLAEAEEAMLEQNELELRPPGGRLN